MQLKRYFDKSISQSYVTVIDIETTGTDTNSGSPILTFGLVSFKPSNITNGVLTDNLQHFSYKGIKPEDFRALGIKGDIATHNWYENYVNAKVCDQNFKMAREGLSLLDGLSEVASVINDMNELAQSEETNHYIFGNSPDFDQAMFNIYFDRVGMPKPWKYWQNLDLRTLAMLFPTTQEKRSELEQEALIQYQENMRKFGYRNDLILDIAKHTAIYDATLEALQLLDILKRANV